MSGVFAKPRKGVKRSRTNLNTNTTQSFDFSPNPGKYGFTLNISVSTKEVTYLSNNDMLYIKYDTVVPIRFNLACEPSELPPGCVIRAMVVHKYKDSEPGVRKPPWVMRCYNHRTEGAEGLHVVTSTLEGSTMPDGLGTRPLCVDVPLSSMRATEGGYTGLYNFSCYTSCFQDPIQAVFDLVAGGELLGRAIVDVRVCACPNRDKKVARDRIRSTDVSHKKRKLQTETAAIDEETEEIDSYFRDNAVGNTIYQFTWELRDPCMYQFLNSLKVGYEKDKKRFLSKKN